MRHIYGWPINRVFLVIFAALALWTALLFGLRRKPMRCVASVVLLCALYAVLRMSLFGRTASEEHVFCFASAYNSEFVRELVMNLFLYFPLGLSLTVLIGPWSILAGFVLSLGIETWQYLAGTGFAQGTDVICNTLGCAIGAIPWLVKRRFDKRRDRGETENKEKKVQNK